MHVILFGLGLMLSSAGLAAIAYGFRDIEFTIGTTLISAGVVAGTGGLLLVGLAAVVHKLNRIAGIQAPQPARELQPAEPQLPGSTTRNATASEPARIPFPPRPQTAEPKSSRAPEPRVPEPRVPESDLGPASDPLFDDMLGRASIELPPEPRIEPRVPQGAPQRPVEPPMVEDHDEVPLSPRPPAKVPLRHAPAPPLTRARMEPRATNGSAASSSAEEPRADASESAQAPVNFDALWPAEKRPGRPPREAARAAPAAPFVERRGEAARREITRPEPPRRSEEAAPARTEVTPSRQPFPRAEPPALRAEPAPLRTEPAARFEPAPVRAEPYVPGSEPPALRIESEQPSAPPPAARPAEPATVNPAVPATVKPAEPPRAVAILKSGVVDGMAYTLYADGSIEAQLSAGTLRFGSIAELREHIEKNS